ncbi:MAG: DUF3570 domain-containing protein [Deltaproteobacteria bacterium]|nr:DUF3570 domain-containing protein [Deltaproteobacteria bacterium]MDQ3297115.1 DUF3570 domain-containing protein [Myxococcota bacterium]
MRLQLAVVALGLAVTAPGFLASSVARADGSISARGVYYKERATRVVQPMLDAMFEVGERGLVNGHFLVDAITSASQSAGAVEAEPFTENRYEVGFGYTHLLDAADGMRLGAVGKYSTESDYVSFYVGLRAEVDLAQKNTTLGIGGGVGNDTISGGPASGLAQLMLQCAPGEVVTTECELATYNGYLSVRQLVSQRAVVGLTYDVAALRGFQSNPYRSAIVGIMTERERHPTERLRQALGISARYFLDATKTTLVAGYRFYRDDWLRRDAVGAGAHTPEVRIVQQVGETADASFGYRFHSQLRAFFYRDRYNEQQMYISDDVKLSRFHTHAVEAKLGMLGEAFELSGRWSAARFEGILQYVAQDNRFGNAFVIHLALTLPFEY